MRLAVFALFGDLTTRERLAKPKASCPPLSFWA